MLKVLLVKTSSLGDVVHNLPVATDIRNRFPGARIDWLVEEAYEPIIALHDGVTNAIPVAIRRWRARPMGSSTWTEIRALRGRFRQEQYDAVVDTQGLIKSALLARGARGRRHGFDAASAREALAARLYDVVHHVARAQHAVVRNRLLAASALGYRPVARADFGIRVADDAPRLPVGPARPYAVLLHSTSRADKLWPVKRWFSLAREFEARGMQCALPWGSAAERARSERIARELDRPVVPGLLPLAEVAVLLARAAVVVGVDTGLVHFAAALGAPVVALFCVSDPALTGVYGSDRARNLGFPAALPEVADVLRAIDTLGIA